MFKMLSPELDLHNRLLSFYALPFLLYHDNVQKQQRLLAHGRFDDSETKKQNILWLLEVT